MKQIRNGEKKQERIVPFLLPFHIYQGISLDNSYSSFSSYKLSLLLSILNFNYIVILIPLLLIFLSHYTSHQMKK